MEHGKNDAEEGEQGWRRDSKHAPRFARNCALVGRMIPERDIAASIAISGTTKTSAKDTVALSHGKTRLPRPRRYA